MDVSTSKEFIKVYEQISKLEKDITEIAKDCYSIALISCDDIEEVPLNLSDLNNDLNFVTEEQADEKIQKIDDSNYLKKEDEDPLKCSVPTTFEELHAKTLDEGDSSNYVATTEFVQNLVQKNGNDAVNTVVNTYGLRKNCVTKSEMQFAIDKAISEVDHSSIVQSIEQEIQDAISSIEIPSKVSELLNDSLFITLDDVPLDLVTSVNNQTGDVVINIPTVPTNISAFTNDVGYITDPGVTSVNNQTGAVSVQENVQADWNASTGLAKILNKPALKRVATTGDYEDLDNVPTKLSNFTNDAGYLTSYTETDPTVPLWAKESTKPSYTASEVGALPDTTIYAGAVTAGGPANKTISIPFGQVDSTSTSTAFTATIDCITELRDGVCCYLRNGYISSASGCTLDINNLGAKPMYTTSNSSTRVTSLFSVGYTYLFVYNSSRIENGCWDLYLGVATSSATSQYIGGNSGSTLPAALKFYRYRLLFTSADGSHYVPANTSTSTNATSTRTVNLTPINPFGTIVYYNTTAAIAAEAVVGYSNALILYGLTLGYSFNRTGAALTLTVSTPVYIKCAPQADGSAIIDADNPYVLALPTTDDGKIYIYLGNAFSATQVLLVPNHPVYYYKDGGIKLWTALESRIASLESRIAALEQQLLTT